MTALTALRADGLLHAFGEVGVLTVADVHVASRLGVLAGESDEQVLLAVALVVRGTRHGSVVLDLAAAAETITADADGDGLAAPVELPWPAAEAWIAACAASPLMTPAPGGPAVRMVGSRLWLARYWRQEAQVAQELLQRSADRPSDLDLRRLRADLDELFGSSTAAAAADATATATDTDTDTDVAAVDIDADQREATSVAVRSRISVIAGGPGTGKTTTIARLITVLRRQQPGLRIALAAPTGKAAARLTEAVHSAAGPLSEVDRNGLAALSASTLHRLLGRRPGVGSRFRHDRNNRLPYDVVIVDECSMVSLTLMARLLEALPAATRLVLVGDPDQLASVEAGAVLGDLVNPDDVGPVSASGGPDVRPSSSAAAGRSAPAAASRSAPAAPPDSALRESVSVLRTVHRFDAGGAIALLAEHVRAGRADEALAMLLDGPAGLVFHCVADDEPIGGAALAAVQAQTVYELAVIEAACAGDIGAALDALDRHRLLCAHRAGARGVQHWSDAVERWLAAGDAAPAPRLDGHYAGQPLLVTANDYENGLYNGDTGVVISNQRVSIAATKELISQQAELGDSQRAELVNSQRAELVNSQRAELGDTQPDDLVAAFRRGGQPIVVPLVRLADVRPLHAMTVHRAQGSQFNEVTVLLPLANSPLATRQTFYTAITRASSLVRLVGSEEAVLACVQRQTARATGLRDRLAGNLSV